MHAFCSPPLQSEACQQRSASDVNFGEVRFAVPRFSKHIIYPSATHLQRGKLRRFADRPECPRNTSLSRCCLDDPLGQ